MYEEQMVFECQLLSLKCQDLRHRQIGDFFCVGSVNVKPVSYKVHTGCCQQP